MAASSYRGFCRICGVTVGALVSFGTFKLLLHRKQSFLRARSFEKEFSNEFELVQVQIAFRHGARTPVCPPPPIDGIEDLIDWNKNEIMGDLPHTIIKNYCVQTAEGKERPHSEIDKKQGARILKGGAKMGQLTKVGQQQMYDTGKRLQEIYINQLKLVNKHFNPTEVFLRTTNIQRTVDSLRCVVAGMFGPNGINVPAVALTLPVEDERWYPNLQCKRLRMLASRVYSTMDLLPGYGKDMINFARAIGKESEKINFVSVRDYVVAMMAHGMQLPEVISSNMEMIEKRATQLIHTVHVNVPFHSEEVLRLGAGNFLEDIYNKMQSKIEGKGKHKLCLYSVHDTSLIVLMSALSVFDNQWPAYGATLAYELYRDKDDKHFVKVLYNEQELTIPECGGVFCPLDRFRKIVKSYAVHDWEKECLRH